MEEDVLIEIVVQPAFAEYRRILYERAHKTIKNLRYALGVLLAAEAIWTFNFLVMPDFDGPIHRVIFIILSIALAVYVLLYSAFTYNLRQQAKKWTGAGGPITYMLSPTGLKSSAKLVTWESPWNRFPKIIETESDLLFFVEGNDFIPIPKRFVSDQTVLPRLRRLISLNATGTVELLS